jgi:lambda family phage minor tail protein L
MSEGNVYEELLNSGPFAIIELFELKTFETMHGSDETYYFHAGRNRKTTEPSVSDDIVSAYSIYWNGNYYLPLPIKAEGFEYKGDGGLPRPTIRVANLNSNITQLLLGVNAITPGNDLNGAQVTRIRTLSRFLDGRNWENGVNPYGNPSTDDAAQMPKEVYYIDRKVTETRDLVEFEMVSSLDLATARAPRRLVMQNLCQWKYRGKECGYSGTEDFTPTGQTIVLTSAANYTYTSGADKLLAGSTLTDGQALISSNGYWTAVMQTDGNFVTYSKPEPTTKFAVWSIQKVRPIGSYTLVMQNDGNLVVYNNAVARNDYNGGSVVWASDTDKIGAASGASLYTVDSKAQFLPSDVYVGRSGALGYELVGSSPSEGQVGTTTTAQKTFTHESEELGTRTITVTFTIEASNLPADHYSGEARAWNLFNSVSFDSSPAPTGKFRNDETFEAKTSLSSGNPFKSNHPAAGSFTEAGILLKITTTGFAGKQLRLQDDGNLVISDTDGTDITWSSGYVNNDEPQVERTVISGVSTPPDVAGQCGKTLDDCKLRFGAGALPFGSFPSVGGNT